MFDSVWTYDHEKNAGMSLIERIMLSRGLTADFTEGDGIGNMHDPFLMNDMEKAVARIGKALRKKEKLLIYGDYDVDGLTSCAMLVLYFRSLGAETSFMIPDRFEEGYGLGGESTSKIAEVGPGLVITTDCGIASHDEIALLRNKGIDAIVTDHHQARTVLPDADSVICCTRSDNRYPFIHLSGSGVAFKLIQAMETASGTDEGASKYLPMAALGTIADVVPLTGENRIIVKNGIDMIKRGHDPVFDALFTVSGRDRSRTDSTDIAYGIAPMLNAAGRLKNPGKAMELLLAENRIEALTAARTLKSLNDERRRIQKQVFERVLEEIGEKVDVKRDKVVVLPATEVHEGVMGIVASMVTGRFNRPAVIINAEGEVCRGSGRSTQGFNLVKALGECDDILEEYGGHEFAAGISVKKTNIAALAEKLNSYADKTGYEPVGVETYFPDAEILEGDIALESFRELEKLEPFGEGNPKPLLLIKDALIIGRREVGRDGAHISFHIEKHGGRHKCIIFNSSGFSNLITDHVEYDIAAEPMIDDYRGFAKPAFMVRDMKLSAKYGNTDDFLISRMMVDMLIYRKTHERINGANMDFAGYLRETGMERWASMVEKGQFGCELDRGGVTRVYRNILKSEGDIFDLRSPVDGMPLHKKYAAMEILKELGVVKAAGEDLFRHRITGVRKKGGGRLENSAIYVFVNSGGIENG